MARERATMDTEAQWQLRNERETLARDSKQRINEMQMTLDRERETTQRTLREVAQLKEVGVQYDVSDLVCDMLIVST